MEPTSEQNQESMAPQSTHREQRQTRNSLGIPIAIVIASMFIAGAIVYTGSNNGGTKQVTNLQANNQETQEKEVAPVTDKDHIRGNPNAPIMIVEYSDFECPFCKNFHETMNKIMAEYGADGKVAWVYRQFPIAQLHPNAPKIAAASECVASLGGNDAFWKFSDLVFGRRGTNEPTNMNKLPDFAVEAGVDKTKFNECLSSGRYDEQINNDIVAAQKAGARGTPYSLLIVGDQQGVINGAQPYATVKQMVDAMITQLAGGDLKN